tara:strand:+ start:1469 stop:1753 length:285 start_codon:yes stop_codon:yes gene_type:complete
MGINKLMDLKQFNYMDLLEHYTQQFKDNISIKEVVYQMAKDNLIDKREMRNRAIIKDYDDMLIENGQTGLDIFDALSYKYNLSVRMIQEIVYKK